MYVHLQVAIGLTWQQLSQVIPQNGSFIVFCREPISYSIMRLLWRRVIMMVLIIYMYYRYFPKFSDGQVWANRADPDQTAPRGAVWSWSTLFAIPSASFGCITLGAWWLSGRVLDSGARGRGFETYRRRVVSLSKTLYSPKVLVNYPGSGGSIPTWLKNCWLGC